MQRYATAEMLSRLCVLAESILSLGGVARIAKYTDPLPGAAIDLVNTEKRHDHLSYPKRVAVCKRATAHLAEGVDVGFAKGTANAWLSDNREFIGSRVARGDHGAERDTAGIQITAPGEHLLHWVWRGNSRGNFRAAQAERAMELLATPTTWFRRSSQTFLIVGTTRMSPRASSVASAVWLCIGVSSGTSPVGSSVRFTMESGCCIPSGPRWEAVSPFPNCGGIGTPPVCDSVWGSAAMPLNERLQGSRECLSGCTHRSTPSRVHALPCNYDLPYCCRILNPLIICRKDCETKHPGCPHSRP